MLEVGQRAAVERRGAATGRLVRAREETLKGVVSGTVW